MRLQFHNECSVDQSVMMYCSAHALSVIEAYRYRQGQSRRETRNIMESILEQSQHNTNNMNNINSNIRDNSKALMAMQNWMVKNSILS